MAEHNRTVSWFSATGAGTADGSTAANAAVMAYDNITNYAQSEHDDVLIFLTGGDFNGAVAGLTVTRGGVTLIFPGRYSAAWGIVNSNAGANAVLSVNNSGTFIIGMYCSESTGTVRGIDIGSGRDGTYICDCYFDGGMSRGVYISGGSNGTVINCYFEWCGIYVIDSGHNLISNNHIWRCPSNAIYLANDAADRNIVEHNTIIGTGGPSPTPIGIDITLGDDNFIVDNFIAGCTQLKSDTGSNNHWEYNHGTLETNWTTALDGTEQDVFGTAALHKVPLNDTGVVRIYPDFNAMAVGDTVIIRVYRKNNGTNSRLALSITKNGVQTDKCPCYDVRYTATRTVRITIQRTAGVIVNNPIGIEEAVN